MIRLATFALLSSVALVAPASARAADLPQNMIGRWCFIEEQDRTQIYARADNYAPGQLACSIGINIRAHSYDGNEYGCTIDKVAKREDAYEVRATCEGDPQGRRYADHLVFEISHGELFISPPMQ
jgi:hypothetical protein